MNASISNSMALDEHEGLRDSYPGLLVDKDIKRLIHIEPFAEGIKRDGVISYGLTSVGYDVRLGTKFKLFNQNFTGVINPKKLDPRAFVDYDTDQPIEIPGGGYLLGETVEEFHIPRNIAVICIGKSTYARVGCSINVTPGEPEWKGRWTVEIENAAPVPLMVFPNEGIMQCLFFRTVGMCEVSYADKKGKYQGDQGLRLAAVDQVKDERPILINVGDMVYQCPDCSGVGGMRYEPGLLSAVCSRCQGTGVVKK